MSTDPGQALFRWRRAVERRAAGQGRPVKRGSRQRPPAAEGARLVEGRWQCPDQLDIWDCIAVVESDESAGQ